MADTRRKSVEFRIAGKVPGVKQADLDDGILETRDGVLIAKLRGLTDNQAEEVFKERVS